MGMDVTGNEPTTKEGEYFRASIWGWPSITTVMEACGYDVPLGWYHNDGEGLDCQEDCDHLATMMEGYLSENLLTFAPTCTEFGAVVSNAIIKGDIAFKDGAGNDAIQVASGDIKAIDQDFVMGFVTFLRGCGGFSIC